MFSSSSGADQRPPQLSNTPCSSLSDLLARHLLECLHLLEHVPLIADGVVHQAAAASSQVVAVWPTNHADDGQAFGISACSEGPPRASEA